jgi:hypothetical protein
MDVQAVLAHPHVAALSFPGDQDLAAVFIKSFDDKGNDFPIDFDEAWCWLGYSTKGNALRKLKGRVFKEGVDCECVKGGVIQTDEGSYEGFAPDKYYLTERAFETFAMVALTEAGERVREFFRAIQTPTSS